MTEPGKTSRPLIKKTLTLDDYVAGIRSGDRVVLSRAITLVESTRPDHREMAATLLERCLPFAGQSVRIGITGSPGVGKSSFIESFGLHALSQGRRLAVLAVDPSSKLSKGSILGDKTRMPQLSQQENAFIRPSPAGDSLGGVARQTRETIVLCEAAGFDVIVVETVGVGQSETAVRSMVDFFLLLLLPGAGDELQGIKRGIVEMADLLAVNKADGDRLALARRAKAEYQLALHLFPPKKSRWSPKVSLCSALNGYGISDIWQEVLLYRQQTMQNGYWPHQRSEQLRAWLYEEIEQQLRQLFFESPAIQAAMPGIEASVVEGRLSSYKAAAELLTLLIGSLSSKEPH